MYYWYTAGIAFASRFKGQYGLAPRYLHCLLAVKLDMDGHCLPHMWEPNGDWVHGCLLGQLSTQIFSWYCILDLFVL